MTGQRLAVAWTARALNAHNEHRLLCIIRAYLLEGHPPDVVLGMCSRQLDLDQDGHFSTALVGVGDLRSGEVAPGQRRPPWPIGALASGPHYLDLGQGLPLGIEPSSYVSTSTFLAPGATLLAFTDGLVERRGESIEMACAAWRRQPRARPGHSTT